MGLFRWEVPGKKSLPIEYKGNVYQLILEQDIIKVYENGQLIIEEDLSEEEMAAHRNTSIPLEEQVLQWAHSVLDTFIQTCGVCNQEKMSFPLELTNLLGQPELHLKKQVDALCPSCIEEIHKQSEQKAHQLKQSFLQGELSIYGGTMQEIKHLLRSIEGLGIHHYLTSLDKSWTLAMMCFSPSRYYLVALKVKNEQEMETFLLLAHDANGKVTGIPPEMGLEALGFVQGDQIQFHTLEA